MTDQDIHNAFTDLNRIISRYDTRKMDNLKRKAFLEPILKELQQKSFTAGKKQANIEAIKYLKEKL